MSEPIGKSGPAMNLCEKLGDAQPRQHAVEPPCDIIGAGRTGLIERPLR
jgi:hypothetical protein